MGEPVLEFRPEDAGAPITRAGCMLLLTMAAGLDGRVVPSQAGALMWHKLLGAGGVRMRAGDAAAALEEHYQESTDVLMPAHLVAIVAEWRDQWTKAHQGGAGPMPIGGPARAALVSGEEIGRRRAIGTHGPVAPLAITARPRAIESWRQWRDRVGGDR